MGFSKFIHLVDQFSEKISLVHVILLSGLFTLISVVNHHGGTLHHEMYTRLPFYLSDTPLLNKIFDSQILEGGYYRARELSYFFDFIDSKFIEFSIENGFPHFLSLTHYLFSTATGCLLWLFCVRELNLRPLIGIGWLTLFWTSPSIFLGGNFFRAGKMGVALSVAILFFIIYKVAVASIKKADSPFSKKFWVLYSISILAITFLDEQGLFFVFTVLLFLTIWCLFVRNKNIYVMLLIGVASVILHVLYRYTIAPQLTFMLNGYWPDFNYQTLPIQSFIKAMYHYLSAGFFLYVEIFRFLIGNPSRIVGMGILLFFIFFPVFYLYTSPVLSANDKKYFILTLVELLITSLFLVIAMNALMVLRHPALISEPNIILTYYFLPTNVLFAMTLVILTDIIYKSRIPKWFVVMVVCFAIIGNIVALHKDNAIDPSQLSFQSSSVLLLNALKNPGSLNYVNEPLIEKNPIIQFFKSKNKNHPDGANTHDQKANIYIEHSQYRLAIEEFNKAILLNPYDFNAYNNRGNIYVTLGQFRHAIVDYNKAIHLNPNCAYFYDNRGKAYIFLGQNQQAIIDYNKAIHLNPNDADAYNLRGHLYLFQRNKNLGCPDAQKACALGKCNALELGKSMRLCP